MNEAFNASDTKALRRAAKQAKIAEAERRGVVLSIMSSPAGRNWMHDRLVTCNIFDSTFTLNPYGSAFNEGRRSIGLSDLADIVRFAPDQYIQMMREASDKEQTNARSGTSGHLGDNSDSGRTDSGRPDNDGSVESEYEPGESGDHTADL